MEQIITQNQFNGGISANSKTGLPNACRFSRNLNIYADNDSVKLNPKPVNSSGSTVTDLLKYMVSALPYTGDKWAVGDTGDIYRYDNSVWVFERNGDTVGNGAAGQGLLVFENQLFYASSTEIGRAYFLSAGSGSMTYNDSFLSDGIINVDNSQTASGQTYTTPTSVSETSANKLSFVPTHDPITKLSIIFGTKGTGNVTVDIHDANNVVVASKTVATGDLPASGAYTFTFDTPWGPILGDTYHFHITSSVADATLQTGTTADISTIDYDLIFGILLADTEYHPMIQHTNGATGTVVIANRDYFAVWDGATYNPNKIRIEPGYKIRGWTRENEFIVAYAWKGSTVNEYEEGRLFYWDGIQPYYNYSKPIYEGLPNTVVSSKNRLFSVLGSKGDMMLGTEPFASIQDAPKLTTGSNVEVMPAAATIWQRRIHFGFSNTNDSNAGAYNYSTGADPVGIEQGVYEFGSRTDRVTAVNDVAMEVLNFAFSPSTSIANPSSFKIGTCAAFGSDFFFSVKDGSSYYVDKVSKSNDPCANGSWESLIIDKGMKGKQLASLPQKTKRAIKVIVTFQPLLANTSVTPKFKIDRADNWTLGTAVTTVGATRAEYSFDESSAASRYKEIEIGFDLAASSSNNVIVTGVSLVFDPLESELTTNEAF